MAQTLPQPVAESPRLWTVEEYERLPEDLFPEGDRVELLEGVIYRKHTGEIRPWSLEEFERIPDEVFPDDVRVELIDGQVYEKMGRNGPHVFAMRYAFRALQLASGPDFELLMQIPLKVGSVNGPKPDISVLRGAPEQHEGPPLDPLRDVALVVEVSDSSLRRDRGLKARLYARFGLRAYWIVNLRDRTLEVRRQPGSESETYVESTVYREDESVEIGMGAIRVADVLPKG